MPLSVQFSLAQLNCLDLKDNFIKLILIKSLFIFIFVAANKTKVLYGLLREPELNIPLEEEDDGVEGEEKPKVKPSYLLFKTLL